MREKEKNHPLKLSEAKLRKMMSFLKTQTPDGRSARVSTSIRPTRTISGGDIIVQVLPMKVSIPFLDTARRHSSHL